MKKLSIFAALTLVFSLVSPGENSQAHEDFGKLATEECKLYGNNSLEDPIRYEDSGHVEDWSKFASPIGSISSLVIPVDFSDVPAITALSVVERQMDEVSETFYALSNGRANIKITVMDHWVRLPLTAKQYMETPDWYKKIYDSYVAASPSVDLQAYDLVLIKTDEKNLVVNVAGALPMRDQLLPSGDRVPRGAFLGTDYWTSIGQGKQVAIHEIMHVFGLPDLYMPNEDGQKPVGIYDLMSSFRLEYRERLIGWHKWKLGWINDSQVNCYSASDSLSLTFRASGEPRIDVLRLSSERVLVIEAYEDPYRPNAAGLLAYVVNTKEFVWRSSGLSGVRSPVQVVIPTQVRNQNPQEWGKEFFPGYTATVEHLKLEAKAVSGGIQMKITKAPIQKTLSSFTDTSTALSASQKEEVSKFLADNPAAQKFICTGIRYYSQPRSVNIIVRKRAKAACEYAKQLNPNLSTWFQTKPTKARSYSGKVLLTIKSPN